MWSDTCTIRLCEMSSAYRRGEQSYKFSCSLGSDCTIAIGFWYSGQTNEPLGKRSPAVDEVGMKVGVHGSLPPKLEYRAVRTSRLYEQIVEQLEDSILKGVLKPGDQLPPERDLAQRFGVSRTAVREAVKALREKGLVEAYTGRGTFVTNGTSQAIRQSLNLIVKISQQEGTLHLAELRRILEPEIAALAAPKIEDQLLATMRESVASMDRSIQSQDPEGYIEADLDFHLALAEAAGNPLILALIDSIVALLREQRSRIFNVEGGPERGQFHHKRILEAIEGGDAEAARKAMQAHLEQVWQDSSASVRSRPRSRSTS